MSTTQPSRRTFLFSTTAAAIVAAAAGCGSGCPTPPPSTRIFRRKNLTADFSPQEQRELSDLVYGYLTEAIIKGHMAQVDHIDNLFSDHRTYLYQIEKLLIRDGHLKYVPLPYWDPVDNIPSGWERVHEPYHFMRLAPYNLLPRAARPRIPERVKPDNVCASGFETAHDLALEVGRSAASAPFSFHFNSHAAMGGPFVSMTTSASALMFWAFHGLLIDLYEKWMTCRFPGTNRRSVVGRRGDGGLEVFTVTSSYELWHARQRLTTTHRDDLDRVMGEMDVEFVHWSHWLQLGAGRRIDDVRVTTDRDGRLVLVARAQGDGPAFDRLVLMRQGSEGWTPWTSLTTGALEIRDFAVGLGDADRIEVFMVRAAAGGDNVVAVSVEGAAGNGSFGPWTEIAPPGAYHRLSVASSHVVVTADSGSSVHVRKTATGWAHETLAWEPLAAIELMATPDGSVEIVAVKRGDSRPYRWLGGAWERIGSGAAALRDLALARNQDGTLVAFATDPAGLIYRASSGSGGAWSDWHEIPAHGLVAGAVAPLAARDYTNTIKLFVRGADNFTHVAEQTAPDATAVIGWATV